MRREPKSYAEMLFGGNTYNPSEAIPPPQPVGKYVSVEARRDTIADYLSAHVTKKDLPSAASRPDEDPDLARVSLLSISILAPSISFKI